LHKKGYIPMSGQIVDASLVPAPKQRNTDGEREAIKAGKTADEIWPDEPAKAAQKDTDARWTQDRGQGALPARRHATAHDRHPDIRLQKSRQHRPALWLHSGCGSDLGFSS
jgi:hypothetical protein